jgi:hypothetical protein
LPRIKLVLTKFSDLLGRQIFKEDNESDKLLYGAKYLWYADMDAFKNRGLGITGAAYAALPHGPQLNNYRDLVELIRESDENSAEPLDDFEERTIKRVVKRFPKDQSIYRAAHEEKIYQSKNMGDLIPYTEAEHITAL